MLDIIREYYGIIIVAVCAVVYGATHRQIALSVAKKYALRFIFLAEAKAEELLLLNGEQKKVWVITYGYDYLPQPVKFIVSKNLFEILVQQVFDAAVDYLRNHKIEEK